MTAGPVIELLGPAQGGIRSHVLELTRQLRAHGTDVVVAGPTGSLGDQALDAVVSVPAGASPTGVLTARRQLAALVAEMGAEVVHAHGLKAAWVAVTTRPRPRVVLTAHNVVLPGGVGSGTPILMALERGVVRRVDHLIAPSPSIDERFAALLPAERRSVILPVSPSTTAPRRRDEVRAELGVDDDALLIVVAARLHPQKDLATFIRAMGPVVAAHPDVAVRIVGDGPSRLEVEELIAAAGLAANVTLVGASSRAVDQMAAADVVALSSSWEAVPLVVVEAMTLGVPVVTTRVGIVDQLITAGVDGWVVDVGDDVALGGALNDALSDPTRLAAVGAAARVAAARLADPAALTAAVQDIYELLGTSVAP